MPSWEQTVQRKQQTRRRKLSAIQTEVQPIHSVYIKATGKFFNKAMYRGDDVEGVVSASEIVQRIAAGEWTAYEVLEAYIAQAARAHAVTNCLTEGGSSALSVHSAANTKLCSDSSVRRRCACRGTEARHVLSDNR